MASTIGKGLISPDAVTQVVVLSALLGAITWNLITWYFGIPSSSSHALVGGLVGAGMAHAGKQAVQGAGLLKIVKSLILSPLIGFLIAFSVMIGILWIVRRSALPMSTGCSGGSRWSRRASWPCRTGVTTPRRRWVSSP